MSLIAPILNEIQLSAFDAIENGEGNILILGQAGTGKSTFVNYLKSASKKRIICVCPTAVSALNIGGQTIHSLFQIAPRDFILPEFLKLKSKPRNIISGADVLIIDEISMVSPDLLDAMDILARQARRNNKPFGGLQIVAIGDLFQLPPVISREAERMFFEAYGFPNSYFFDSHSYKRAEFGRVSFDFVYRQADEELLLNLCALRKGGDTSTSIAYFNGRKISDPAKLANAVVLTPYRAVADQINHAKLTAVVAPEVLYKGELSGNFPEKDTPSPVELRLKTGALVVFTKNSDRGDWHNGSMGIVQDLGHDIIKVKLLSDGNIVDVKRDKWQKIEYARDDNDKLTENESGSFKQFPLALGYAMTIHKSQGKTLDAVNIDMSRGAFAHGQTYVALSRTRRADDIHMQSCLRPRDVIFDRRVLEFVVE